MWHLGVAIGELDCSTIDVDYDHVGTIATKSACTHSINVSTDLQTTILKKEASVSKMQCGNFMISPKVKMLSPLAWTSHVHLFSA